MMPMPLMVNDPDISSALAPLISYDNNALRELVENDTKVEEYIRNLSQCHTLANQKDMKFAQNKSLAEYNLSMEPAFESGKNALKELSKEIETLSKNIQEKEEKMLGNKSSSSTETVLALLQTAAAQSEEDSENIVDSFYEKNVDVEQFLDKFQEVRKEMHLRRVKAEKMVELISKESSRRNSGLTRRAAPLPPYPVGPPSFFNHH